MLTVFDLTYPFCYVPRLDVPTELADDDVMRRRVAKKANANK